MNQSRPSFLIIIIRYNGDVYLTHNLIEKIVQIHINCDIDIMVDKSTENVAQLLPNVRKILTFDYELKKKNSLSQEIQIIKQIYKKYDYGISLTTSDRSVFYSILSAKESVSAIDEETYKNWWKKIFLNKTYFWNREIHIVENNFQALKVLGYKIEVSPPRIIAADNETLEKIKEILRQLKIDKFIILHMPSKYIYKMYSKENRDILLNLLSKLDIDIVATGGKSQIDKDLSISLPNYPNLHNLIGKISIKEFYALSSLSIGYIGVDTLNIHIAASQRKKIFGIYGPTNIDLWKPWSENSENKKQKSKGVITYDNVTIFSPDMLCAGCGRAGCDDKGTYSFCLETIDPYLIHNEVSNWLKE